MSTIIVKRGDTRPALTANLSTAAGPIDLTGATVRFVMGNPGEAAVVNAAATIVDAAAGTVRYSWLPADTDTAGMWRAEWEITWPDGVQTVPADGYDLVRIVSDLG